MRSSLKHALLFVLVSLGVSLAVYRDAMWGGSLLAPLDLGPAVFTNYQFMDPDFDGVPDNHFIIDQFTYDRPLQKRIHESYRSGEIPWWDPYTYGGRPLLADAHINGTDPIRLACYLTLPFELAYNWNYILRGILTGLGMYLLLRKSGVRPVVSGILGITFQFAGWFTMYFGHPWIQASFLYFPYLWLAWLNAVQNKFGLHTAFGGILCGAVFYSGNLQSHTYLPVFALAFILSSLNGNRNLIGKALATTVVTGVVGALLAYPVLVNQIEFLLQNQRGMTADQSFLGMILAIPVSLMGFFPWVLGTFRTISPGSALGVDNVTFNLFFGTLSGLLVILGAARLRKAKGLESWLTTQSVGLIAIYLLIVSTPLSAYFYPRSAGLAGIAIAMLTGLTMERLLASGMKVNRAILLSFGLFVTSAAVLGSLAAWFVYPHIIDSVTEKVIKEIPNRDGLASSPALMELRLFQIRNFSSEVSLHNPEAALSLAAVLCFIYGLSKAPVHPRNKILIGSLVLSSLPVVMFHARFRPKHPIEMWQKMEEGGPAQKAAVSLAGKTLRVDERAAGQQDFVFPYAMASLYKVHAVFGYSALQPPSLFRLPSGTEESDIPGAWIADIRYEAAAPDTLSKTADTGSSRFRIAKTGEPAPVSVIRETLNSISLDTSNLADGDEIIRTDTWYPGWSGGNFANLSPLPPCFSMISENPSKSQKFIELSYKPTGLRGASFAMGSGFLLILVLPLCGFLKQSRPKQSRQTFS